MPRDPPTKRPHEITADELEDIILAAARAAIPPDLLRMIELGSARRSLATRRRARRARTCPRNCADGRSARARGALREGGWAWSRPCAPPRLGSGCAADADEDPRRVRVRAGGFPHPALQPEARHDGDLRRRRLGLVGDAAARRGQGRDRTAAGRLLRPARQRRAGRVSRQGRRDRAAADALARARQAHARRPARRRRHADRAAASRRRSRSPTASSGRASRR